MIGYSNAPLFKKLGMKDGLTVSTVHAPKDYRKTVNAPNGVAFKTSETKPVNILHVFIKTSAELSSLPHWRDMIVKNGALWISWPKKSAGVTTDLTEDIIRNIALKNGLVDVKVCAFDETWSCLKLVFRLKDR